MAAWTVRRRTPHHVWSPVQTTLKTRANSVFQCETRVSPRTLQGKDGVRLMNEDELRWWSNPYLAYASRVLGTGLFWHGRRRYLPLRMWPTTGHCVSCGVTH